MDIEEARSLLREELNRFRLLTYSELVALVDTEPHCTYPIGASGAEYQIEIQIFGDGGRKAFVDGTSRNIRVMGAIDDGCAPYAFTPLCESYIMRPDGTFIGE
jgi:hypothetical protein